MNFNHRKSSFVLLAVTAVVLVTTFANYFLLTNPGDNNSLGLLIKPAQAQEDDGSYGLDTTAGQAKLPTTGLPTMAGKIIGAALSLLGVVFLVLMVYGGILWMTAHGNAEQLKKSRDVIIAAIVGLIVVLMAYAITSFIMDNLATTSTQYNPAEEGVEG